MNPFVLGLLGMLVRQGILVLAGALGIGPLVQQYVADNMSSFTQFSIGVAALIAAVGYAAYRKFLDRQKLMQALSAAHATERTIELMVKDHLTETPSVLTAKHDVPQ